ncbi:MAG: bifunctional DNA-formamidopyrimidine glycosylase/DNA-(apurinic or apyrimidinic site) lyase [Desulfarculus sp.]|nr:bifunctional DNA-formamidopyrimidine glycosylase/DNA-(apurinic or apyrimidinic site) lyase [Desulfarculus sp.]
MPELPEVESVRRTLMPRIQGRRIAKVEAREGKLIRPSLKVFRKGLTGRQVLGSERRGKLLMLGLEGGAFLAVHLGMTGQLIMAAHRPQADHLHVVIGFEDGGESLFYRDVRRFGFLAFCPDRAALLAGPLANYGPDALGMADALFVERLAGRRTPLKSLLLDQRALAGVGNIYADEALHRAGLSPCARAADLDRADLLRLHEALQETLAESLERGGSSVRNFVDAEGRPGTFQEAHRVYRRTGQPCPACGATVEKIVLAGRSTHFCPRCQPAPR